MERKKDESRGSANDGSGRRRRRVRAQRMKKCAKLSKDSASVGPLCRGKDRVEKEYECGCSRVCGPSALRLVALLERKGEETSARVARRAGAALARREKSPTLEIGNFEKREQVLRPRGSRGRRRRKGTGSNSRVVVTHPIFLPALDFRNFSTCGWRERGVMGVSARLKIVAVRWNNCKRTGPEGV